jgi:hypothetical protein
VKKIIVATCLSLVSAFAFADQNGCLADLLGKYLVGSEPGKAKPELMVQQNSKGWQFTLPDEARSNRDSLYRYHFDRKSALDAKSIPDTSLQQVGYAMLVPYLDKGLRLDGVTTDCGLTVDGIFLVRIDLSKADNRLLENIIMVDSALSSVKPDSKRRAALIKALRGPQYFAGKALELEGVINGITPWLAHKAEKKQ